ncbi:MAG: hypothetical protein WCV80_02845 [Candidatus Paceibacterota bacterium]
MKKTLIVTIVAVIILLGIVLVYRLPTKNTETSSVFKGPTGTPSVKGPSGPPPGQ